MKRFFSVLLKVLLGILCAMVLAIGVLFFRWLAHREDPAAFLPDKYMAYLQVPSIRGIFEEWLNLEVADAVLARPDLAQYRRVVTSARGLALTRSPILRNLLDVQADIMLLQNRKLLAVVPLGWRGMFTPLARLVGPVLNIKGFSFLNESGIPMYRYKTGETTIHAAFMNDIAIVSLDPDVVKDALARRASDSGLAARASRELLDRVRLRSGRAVRVLADTRSLSSELLSGSGIGAKLLDSMELPGQSMLDVELGPDRLTLGADLPLEVTMPELSQTLARNPAPIGVLRYVPASSYFLSVSNVAPLADMYRLAAAFQGADVEGIYTRADSGARTVVGAGIDELLFSWVGAEIGAFMAEESGDPVFFARIADRGAYKRAMDKITKSLVATKDSSLVLDGVRIDRISIPWYLKTILDTIGMNVPEPYFITLGGYFFLSLDAQNLAAVAKAGDTADNLAHVSLFARLSQGIPSDASLLLWYDIERTEPFFIRGSGLLADVLRLYGRGVAAVRATPAGLRVALSAAHGERLGLKLLPGFPLSPDGGVSADVLAFHFRDNSRTTLAWLREGSALVFAEADGTPIREEKLEPDSTLVADGEDGGAMAAVWAVSPGGTVWRFGPDLKVHPPFPMATGISGPMPPKCVGGKLALYSKADSALVLIGEDGERSVFPEKLEAPLFAPPDYSPPGRLAFFPKSFDSKVHLADLDGTEAAGWPVDASGISFCSPRFVHAGESNLVAFMTQAGSLHLWDIAGKPVAPFPLSLPGVYYATPQQIRLDDGASALVTLSQDGGVSIIGLDGAVIRQTSVADLDGKKARILVADLFGNGRQDLLLYGSGAFICGYDASLRPLGGFPVKGVSRPQLIDVNGDGAVDFLTAGIDGKIYGYSMGRGK